MNKRDRRTLLLSMKRDILNFLAVVAYIAVAFTFAYSVKCIAEVVHGEEVVEEIDEKREKREKRCKYYDACMARLSSSTLEAQHYHCVKYAEEKLKNK